MRWMSQARSGFQKHSTSSLWVRRLPFLPSVRQCSIPPLLHSKSTHPSRNARTQTKTSTSRRASSQTGCCRDAQIPLSAFPKTFLLTELKKGYFPHKFNIPENQEYVGPIPAQDYYMPETMSRKARQEFETWHQEQRDNDVVFDFQKELVAYC